MKTARRGSLEGGALRRRIQVERALRRTPERAPGDSGTTHTFHLCFHSVSQALGHVSCCLWTCRNWPSLHLSIPFVFPRQFLCSADHPNKQVAPNGARIPVESLVLETGRRAAAFLLTGLKKPQS